MKTFQYQVLRYLPDRVSGEFINLGVVVYLNEVKELKAMFHSKTGRMHAFFPSVNTKFIVRNIKQIEAHIKKVQEEFQQPLFAEAPVSIEDITKQVLPKDDSALYFTDVAKILDVNIDSLLNSLFERLVLKNVHETEHETLADSAVWRQYYKTFFDKYNLTDKLKPKTVKTKADQWNFEHTCKNGALHCFESVSFDLSSDDYIKKKVYTWAGKIDELKTAKEHIHLYLLTALPEKVELKKFIRMKLDNLKLDNAFVEVVDTNSADKVIRNVKKQMEEHV